MKLNRDVGRLKCFATINNFKNQRGGISDKPTGLWTCSWKFFFRTFFGTFFIAFSELVGSPVGLNKSLNTLDLM